MNVHTCIESFTEALRSGIKMRGAILRISATTVINGAHKAAYTHGDKFKDKLVYY